MDKLTNLIFDIVVAVIIIFVSVMIYFGLRSETAITTMDTEVTESFLSDVKEKGSITSADYERYMYQLSLTGVIYEVLMEHRFNSLEPEYRMRSLEEIIAAQKAAYTGENIYHYKDIVTQIPVVTDPIDNSGLSMNTETNESILAGAVNTPATGHVHTDDCYIGHKHKGTKTFTHSHAHTGSCTRYLSVASYIYTCPNCGQIYYWTQATYYWDTATNSAKCSWVNTNPITSCSSCNYPSLTVTPEMKYAYSCGYNIDENGDGMNDTVPTGVYKNYSGMYSPQSIERADYTSGCYTYHNARNFTSNLPIGEITADYKTKFCSVPQYYTFNFETSYNGSYNNYSVYYYGTLQTDGSILLTRYNVSYSYLTGYTPSTISLDEMCSLGFDISRWNNYKLYQLFISGVSIYSKTPNLSGEIILCNHNVKPENRWVEICGQVENATLTCNQKVVSITPTNPVQSVYTNEPLITTVKATYQDGSKKVVLGTTSFTTGTPILNKIITLSYTDTLGLTNTCNATVNVIPRTKVCVNGHLYNLNNDGSDPGCIFCNAYVRTIMIIQPNTSTWTINIGTNLSDNGLKLLVTYLDGHTETLTAGYEDNLDKQYLGTKMVTIGYKGATTQILVTTVCAKLTCDLCGFSYELYPDGTNPGCPRCISKTPVFTGNILNYESVNYTDDILEDLYQDGIYRFNKDDTLFITIENKSSSISRKLLRLIFPNMTKTWIHFEESETIQSK